jgi:hypothetical protein
MLHAAHARTCPLLSAAVHSPVVLLLRMCAAITSHVVCLLHASMHMHTCFLLRLLRACCMLHMLPLCMLLLGMLLHLRVAGRLLLLRMLRRAAPAIVHAHGDRLCPLRFVPAREDHLRPRDRLRLRSLFTHTNYNTCNMKHLLQHTFENQ